MHGKSKSRSVAVGAPGRRVDDRLPRHEWGVPVHDDRKQFEFLTLESAQAGLSWATVLRKREDYRRAFAEFDPEKVARFTAKRIEKMLTDPGIIRNRLKVTAAVTNARCFLEVQEEFGRSTITSGSSSTAGRCRTGSSA